jgi:hypothetical protein
MLSLAGTFTGDLVLTRRIAGNLASNVLHLEVTIVSDKGRGSLSRTHTASASTHPLLDSILHPYSSANRRELHLAAVTRLERLLVRTVDCLLLLLVDDSVVIRFGVLFSRGSLALLLSKSPSR